MFEELKVIAKSFVGVATGCKFKEGHTETPDVSLDPKSIPTGINPLGRQVSTGTGIGLSHRVF